MSLRAKTLLIMGVTLAGLVIAVYLVSGNIMLGGYASLEESYARQNVNRFRQAYQANLEELDAVTAAWASNVAVRRSSEGAYPEADRAFNPGSLSSSELDFAFIVEPSGRVAVSRGVSADAIREAPVPQEVKRRLVDICASSAGSNGKLSGLTIAGTIPLVFAAHPITSPENPAVVAGKLVAGRYLDSSEIKRLGEVTSLSIDLRPAGDPELPQDYRRALPSVVGPSSTFVEPLDSDRMAGYTMMRDMSRQPCLIIRVDMPRGIYRQGMVSNRHLAYSLILSCIIFVLVTILFLENTMLSRIGELNSGVKRIADNADLSMKVRATGHDELSGLAGAINRMVEALRQAHDELETRVAHRTAELADTNRTLELQIAERLNTEASLRVQTSAINATADQVMITDSRGTIQFVNPAFERETGYSSEEVIGQTPRLFKSGEHQAGFYAELWRTILSGETWKGEIVTRHKDGHLFTEDMTVTPVKDAHGQISHFIAIRRNITEKKVYQEKLDRLAHHDALTGLPNRLLFSDRLIQSLAQARRTGKSLAVMFFDLDRFKLINDTLGHSVGDILLQEVAKRLAATLRDVDTIARMGGDEFTVILSNVKSTLALEKVARKVLKSVSGVYLINGRELFVTTSIGISVYPADGLDAEMLVGNADAAMYKAKEQGRNKYHFYADSMDPGPLGRMALERDLANALLRDELEVHYQPRIDLKTGMTVGVEALVRWRHPELGLIPPGQFISIAEETGSINQISEFVLHTACEQNKAWQDAGLPRFGVAVNISPCLLREKGLLEMVNKALADTGLSPAYLHLEVTESTLMHSTELASDSLQQLKHAGVKISIDDFGTGYSSLNNLKKFPLDSVNIDRSFINDITTNPDDAAIAGAIIAMGHSLKLRVVAEGVETLSQLEFLQSLNCDEIQGYFISRPLPADKLTELMEDARKPIGGRKRDATLVEISRVHW